MTALSIGQVAERTGLSVHTLRMYEREGLFTTDVHRNPKNRRVYGQADLDWLEVCTKFRASGMPLEAIRQFADLVRKGPGNEAERLELLRAHQLRIERKMAELTDCLDLIVGKVAVYEQHVRAGTATDLWTGIGPPA
ncbi:MerR family transcriptional regulator [Dactylosporangium cerinum]|uniref:MerR family transcriptional regulator n=1 Tax=Dactylosporangium cerinum TaxID=1434730 RepID=A0ABV9W1P4_9ACTN